MGKTNAERFAATGKRAQALSAEVARLVQDIPQGEVKRGAEEAWRQLERVVKLAQREVEFAPMKVAAKERDKQATAESKQLRAEAGDKAQGGTRVVGGRLLHGLEEGQSQRMGEVWFHGTVTQFDELGARAPKSETRGFNPRLGLHFASEYRSADAFAAGLYRKGRRLDKMGKVYSVKLHSQKTKVFASERALNGDFFDFCLKSGDLKKKEIESVRSYRRIPKGDIGGPVFWEKVAISAGSDISASLQNLDAVVSAYREYLSQQGYDAVAYLNDIEGYATPCAIVFQDKQVEALEVLAHGVAWEGLGPIYEEADFQKRLEGLVLGA